MSQEQLNAACDEAKKLGLRTVVHAYGGAVRAATSAGCTQIEHGTLATDDDLKLMAEKGTYLDPQAGLIIENYLRNKQRYLGTPGYTEEGFAAMEQILPMNHDLVRRASKIPNLKIVFGTDAVAGSHGNNAEEFIDRVRDGGVNPMTATRLGWAIRSERSRRASKQTSSRWTGIRSRTSLRCDESCS
jgi:imidazolonepropionase-like amidohydrolase